MTGLLAATMSTTSTAAERFVAAHREFAANGGQHDPTWLRELRGGAIARFGELGFPTTRQEDWRFTNVGPLAELVFERTPEVTRPVAPTALAPFVLGAAAPHGLVFVNGRFSAALSQVERFPAGVRAESLKAALRRDPAAVERHLGRVAAVGDHAFQALNTAFLDDGAFVEVAAGVTLGDPLQLLFLTTPGTTPVVTHPRSLIVMERGSRAAVVETYAALGTGRYWTNAVTEIVVGDGARLDCHRIQREGEDAFHVATTESRQGRDSTLNLHLVAFGGVLARHDLRTGLDGPGATAVLNGLYLPRNRQHVDHHTVIDHRAPHCESHEYFNGVLDGHARSVFNGRIIVRPGAQRTDSKQTNSNMLLSAEARADSQPQLEIYADDVKCTHGSTTGPLDERHVFYLRSRGLDPAAARQLLTYGFSREILERMEVGPLRDQLDALVRERVWG